jgi:predicted PurR-regulated permease PerM
MRGWPDRGILLLVRIFSSLAFVVLFSGVVGIALNLVQLVLDKKLVHIRACIFYAVLSAVAFLISGAGTTLKIMAGGV